MVPFVVVLAVIGHKFLKAVITLVLVGVVGLVAYLLALGAVLAFAIEASGPGMVLMGYATLEGAVQWLGVFLLGVLRCAEVYELEYLAGTEESVLVLRHKVSLDLYAAGDAPAVLADEPEHIPEAVHHKGVILAPGISGSDTALADHIIGIIGMHPLVAFHAARKVDVIHCNLRQ